MVKAYAYSGIPAADGAVPSFPCLWATSAAAVVGDAGRCTVVPSGRWTARAPMRWLPLNLPDATGLPNGRPDAQASITELETCLQWCTQHRPAQLCLRCCSKNGNGLMLQAADRSGLGRVTTESRVGAEQDGDFEQLALTRGLNRVPVGPGLELAPPNALSHSRAGTERLDTPAVARPWHTGQPYSTTSAGVADLLAGRRHLYSASDVRAKLLTGA